MPRIIVETSRRNQLIADQIEGLLEMRIRSAFAWDEDTLKAELERMKSGLVDEDLNAILTLLQTRPNFRVANPGAPEPPENPQTSRP